MFYLQKHKIKTNKKQIQKQILTGIGKQRALSLEITCHFRLYLKKGRTSVTPS